MNEINSVAALISTIGFPIVACGALAWYVYHLTKTVTKLGEVVANNTRTIDKLCDKLENLGDKLGKGV